MCGGQSGVKQADEEVNKICEEIKAAAGEKCGKQFETFTAISYKTQVVAGTNYFIKINVGGEEHIHVRVFQALPHTGAALSVHSVQQGKTVDEDIAYF